MDDVKAKLDSVQQVSFYEDMKLVDVGDKDGDEENVNFISGTGFQN